MNKELFIEELSKLNVPLSEKQLEQLKNEIKELNEKLENRTITIKEAGSIADASLKINKIFEAAQQAADEYLRSIK